MDSKSLGSPIGNKANTLVTDETVDKQERLEKKGTERNY